MRIARSATQATSCVCASPGRVRAHRRRPAAENTPARLYHRFQQQYGESGQRCGPTTSAEFKRTLQDSMVRYAYDCAAASSGRR